MGLAKKGSASAIVALGYVKVNGKIVINSTLSKGIQLNTLRGFLAAMETDEELRKAVTGVYDDEFAALEEGEAGVFTRGA